MELCDHLSIASPTTDLTILYCIDSCVGSVLFDVFSPFSHHETSGFNCVYGLYTVAPLLWLWLHSVLYTLYIHIMILHSSHTRIYKQAPCSQVIRYEVVCDSRVSRGTDPSLISNNIPYAFASTFGCIHTVTVDSHIVYTMFWA